MPSGGGHDRYEARISGLGTAFPPGDELTVAGGPVVVRPSDLPSVAFISTYVPRRCGIATFTRDLRDGILTSDPEATDRLRVVALQAPDELGVYPPEVRHSLPADEFVAYKRTADELEQAGVQVVSLQHEYGIFGGPDGLYVLELADRLRMPIVTTLHTILRRPSPHQREILTQLALRSAIVVVMTERARQTLIDTYSVEPERINVIPHGVPDMPFVDPETAKARFGLAGRPVILSFGLLGPNKRIELVLDALATIAADAPDVRYVVVGATHPELRRRFGESYRASLLERAERLGLGEHVQFVDRYVDPSELVAWLEAADIFVTPYGNVAQATSGTLAYALACGKAIVSTPYDHAIELLDDGRGVLVPFDDADALSTELRRLLTDREARDALRAPAYAYGRAMIWPTVGTRYRTLFARASEPWPSVPARIVQAASTGGSVGPNGKALVRYPVPPVVRRHHDRLSDGIGIFQHADGPVPNPVHGYCTDDVARALIIDLLHAEVESGPVIAAAVRRSIAFLEQAFDPVAGRFRNFLGADGTWLEAVGSEDSHARAIQALGETLARSPDLQVRATAGRLFVTGLAQTLNFSYVRPWAYVILGCDAVLRRTPWALARDVLESLATRLADAFVAGADGTGGRAIGEWPWPERIVTYDNGVLTQALIVAGRRLRRDGWVELGLQSLRWLGAAQTDSDGHLAPIGNRGWWRWGGVPARFDQQPIEAVSLLEAARAAYEATGDKGWAEVMERAYEWFLGNNDLRVLLAEPERGACRDGLGPEGPSGNQGAESTLAWLLSVERIRALRSAVAVARPDQAPAATAGSAATARPADVVRPDQGPAVSRPGQRPGPAVEGRPHSGQS